MPSCPSAVSRVASSHPRVFDTNLIQKMLDDLLPFRLDFAGVWTVQCGDLQLQRSCRRLGCGCTGKLPHLILLQRYGMVALFSASLPPLLCSDCDSVILTSLCRFPLLMKCWRSALSAACPPRAPGISRHLAPLAASTSR